MSKIKKLREGYLQQSRVFLYPLLGIKRGSSVTPIQTYVAWKGHNNPGDTKLTCLYHLRKDQDFKVFQQRITNNKLFYKRVEVEEDKVVYLFDFSSLQQDWDYFLAGKYSRLSRDSKKKIENFFGNSDAHYAYIHSWLYPSRYYQLYADLLTTSPADAAKMILTLKEVGELNSPPDLEKETLTAEIKNLEVKPVIP